MCSHSFSTRGRRHGDPLMQGGCPCGLHSKWPVWCQGRPMEKGGLRAGDVLEAVNGQWFVARAHFQRDHPIGLSDPRGEQHLPLRVTIAAPAWLTWSRAQFLGVIAFYFVRFILLLLAILVGF